MKKKWLLALLAVATCIAGTLGLAACNDNSDNNDNDDNDESKTKHEHSWSAWSLTETPTATKTGKATRTCGNADCNATAADLEYTLPTLESTDYSSTGDTATCENGGKITYTYNHNNLNVSFDVATNATGHDWNEWTLIDDNKPTATAEGKVTRTCKHENCDAAASDKEYTLPTLDSTDYSSTDDTATCENGGKITYTYNQNGVNVSLDVTTLATGHDWNEWTLIDENKPTATAAGKATRTCKHENCDADVSDKEYPLPDLTSRNYTLTNNTANCTQSGTATYTYNWNGVNVSLTADSPAKGHSVVITTGKSATCEEDGYTESRICSSCLEVLKEKLTIPARGHNKSVLSGVAATCNETGLSDGVWCANCKIVFEEREEIPTTGHVLSSTLAPNVDEEHKTVSQRCSICNMSFVYEYDNAVLNAAGNTGSPSALCSEVYTETSLVTYVTQSTKNPFLSYTFKEAGTYSIYWEKLKCDKINITTASTVINGTTTSFISSSKLQKDKLPEGFAIEGYATGSFNYYVSNGEGGYKSQTANKGDYLTLTKENCGSASYITPNIIPVKLTLTVAADTTLKFKNELSSAGEQCLIGINKAPTVSSTYLGVAASNFAIIGEELAFTSVVEAGKYTFTAEVGEFELYVNDELQEAHFGYIDFRDRYLTVDLAATDKVTVKKISGTSKSTISINAGEIEEPSVPEYNRLNIGENAITLQTTGALTGAYEKGDETFYLFTPVESGYYNISVAEDVNIDIVIRTGRENYTTVLDVKHTNKHDGVFYAEAGEIVIIAFTDNGELLEFNVNIAPCEEPAPLCIEVGEPINVVFNGIDSLIVITVGESVTGGAYYLEFDVSVNLQRSFIYFSVNAGVEVDDWYDTNAIGRKYINLDMADGAYHTVGANTIGKPASSIGEYKRGVTLEAGDVIYLVTDSPTAGTAKITLTPIE